MGPGPDYGNDGYDQLSAPFPDARGHTSRRLQPTLILRHYTRHAAMNPIDRSRSHPAPARFTTCIAYRAPLHLVPCTRLQPASTSFTNFTTLHPKFIYSPSARRRLPLTLTFLDRIIRHHSWYLGTAAPPASHTHHHRGYSFGHPVIFLRVHPFSSFVRLLGSLLAFLGSLGFLGFLFCLFSWVLRSTSANSGQLVFRVSVCLSVCLPVY